MFEPRPVELGLAYGNRITVTRGLVEGDRVVTSGNFLIDSESRMKPGASQTVNEKHEAAPVPRASAANDAALTHDPVCGMSLERDKARASGHTETYRGESFVFCSDKCQRKFQQDPAKYVDDKMKIAAEGGSRHEND